MSELLLANVESGTPDDEIKGFLVKYGFPPFDEIEHLPGDGSRPSVLLTFKEAGPETLRNLLPRIQDVYWNMRKLHAQVLDERYNG